MSSSRPHLLPHPGRPVCCRGVTLNGQDAPDLVKRLSGHSGAALAAVANPVRQAHLLSSARDHTVRLWDIEAGKTVGRLNRAAFQVTAPCPPPLFGPTPTQEQGRGLRSEHAPFLELVRFEGCWQGTEQGGSTCSLDFSACGSLALTAGGVREVWVWDMRTCTPVRRLIGSGVETVCASFRYPPQMWSIGKAFEAWGPSYWRA